MKKHNHIGEGFRYHGNIWIIVQETVQSHVQETTNDNGDLLTIRRYEGKKAIDIEVKATEGRIIAEEAQHAS